jgi:hypothetical protein
MIALMICDDCNTQMEEVFTAQEDFRLKGWMCPSCFHFAEAIGRERLYKKGDDDGDQTGSV